MHRKYKQNLSGDYWVSMDLHFASVVFIVKLFNRNLSHMIDELLSTASCWIDTCSNLEGDSNCSNNFQFWILNVFGKD